MRTDQGVIARLQAYVSFNMCDEFGVHGHQTYSYTYLLQNCNNGSCDIIYYMGCIFTDKRFNYGSATVFISKHFNNVFGLIILASTSSSH